MSYEIKFYITNTLPVVIDEKKKKEKRRRS